MSGMNEVYAFLKGKVFYPATTDDKGQAHVRPFGAVAHYNGRVYICTNSEKSVSQQLKKGYVEIAAADDSGDWIRINSGVVLDSSPDAEKHMFAENPVLKEIYAGREQLFEVFYLAEGTATLYNMAGTEIWSVVI